MSKLLTFTSDFGADSHYVAQMKAAALRLAPDATLVDITHSIGPQDIAGGAVVLQDCLPEFPPGSVHVAVVDPGVGTARAVIAADLDGRVVVAPDNGLISLAKRSLRLRRAVRIEHRAEFGTRHTATFHGRDIMAPAAALICQGAALADLGPPIQPVELPISDPVEADGQLTGEVVLVDSFGNLITNILGHQLPDLPMTIQCRARKISGLEVAYADQPAGRLVALIGSSHRLEIAVVGGSAAGEIHAAVGESVQVVWGPAETG